MNRHIYLIVFCLLVAYLLPWVHNQPTSLTLNAYDWAEWLSNHPATHPQRLPTLLLRSNLLIITVLFALATNSPRWKLRWFSHGFVVLVLAIAQLPPPEFIRNVNDANQAQQAILASSSLIMGILVLLVEFPDSTRKIGSIMTIVATISVSSVAQILGMQRMAEYGLRADLAVGSVLYVVLGLLGIIVIFFWKPAPTEDRESRSP